MWHLFRLFTFRHHLVVSMAWLALVCVCVPYAYKAFFEARGGVLDDALPAGDPIQQMNAEAMQEPNFNSAEAAFVVVKFQQNTADGVMQADQMSDKLAKLGQTAMSLRTIKKYVLADDGGADGVSYTDTRFSPGSENWKKLVEVDSSVFCSIVGKNWLWTAVGIILKPGYEEISEAWNIVGFLEGRSSYSIWERFLKADITPMAENVGVAGWIMIRWMIDQCLNRDMLMLVTLGVVISLGIFGFALRSMRQAALATTVCIVASILFELALIYCIHILVPKFSLRVYSLLAFANIIVQGTSFGLHKFGAFREEVADTGMERFAGSLQVDTTIGVTGGVSILAFLSLYSYEIWQLMELGYQAVLGVALAYASATVFLPCVYLTIEHMLGPEQEKGLVPISFRWYASFVRVMTLPRKAHVAIVACAVLISVMVFVPGIIPSRTRPLDYVQGTAVEEMFYFLRDNGSATDILSFRVKQRKESTQPFWEDIPFLNTSWEFEKSLQNGGFETWQKSRGMDSIALFGVSSILPKVSEISKVEDLGEMPETPSQAADIFEIMLVDNIERDMRQWLWNTRSIRLNLGVNGDDSDQLRTVLNRVMLYAETQYPGLVVVPFGKLATFPSVDGYIGNGVVQNFSMSFLLVAVIAGVWLWVQYRPDVWRIALIGAIVASPFVVGVAAIGLIMLSLGMDISMSTVPIADLAVSAGNDFSLYIAVAFFAYYRVGMRAENAREHVVYTMGPIVLMDCVLNSCAFAPLIFSQFEPVRELGGLMIGMLCVCYYGAAFIVPSLLAYVVKDSSLKNQQPPEVLYESQTANGIVLWYAVGGGGGGTR